MRVPMSPPTTMPTICVTVNGRLDPAVGTTVGDGVELVVVVDGLMDVCIVSIVMVGWVDVGGRSEVGGGMLDGEDGALVGSEEDGRVEGGTKPVVVVGAADDGPLGMVGIVAVGASVLGIAPEGTNTVVVTNTVVTALGATKVVEKTVLVSVARTMLCRRTVVRTWDVMVEVTTCSCLASTFRSGREDRSVKTTLSNDKSPTTSPSKEAASRSADVASRELPTARLRPGTNEVAVTVAVWVCWVGFSRVMTMVLVEVTRPVVGEPVNRVTVLVRVCVIKTVETAAVPTNAVDDLLKLAKRFLTGRIADLRRRGQLVVANGAAVGPSSFYNTTCEAGRARWNGAAQL